MGESGYDAHPDSSSAACCHVALALAHVLGGWEKGGNWADDKPGPAPTEEV